MIFGKTSVSAPFRRRKTPFFPNNNVDKMAEMLDLLKVVRTNSHIRTKFAHDPKNPRAGEQEAEWA